jgi:hypothetical protein
MSLVFRTHAMTCAANSSPSPPSWRVAMTDRQLIDRLLFLAQTAVDQALDLNYDDPEDYFIYRELRELKAVAAELEGVNA